MRRATDLTPDPTMLARAAATALVTAALTAAAALAPTALRGQDPALEPEAEANAALRVFFDCEGGRWACDFDFYRREIDYVNYTRDREDAQVHVLLTSEGTGSGGRRFTFDYIGRGEFEGVEDRLETTTRANIPQEEQLTTLARTLELGLVRYIARTSQAGSLDISFDGEGAAEGAATPDDDAWDFWTFRIDADIELDVDERTQSYEYSAGFSADRVTEGLKLEFSMDGELNEERFETSDSTSVTSHRDNYGADALGVWSLSDHWSAGVSGAVGHSTYSNEDLQARIGPALEYNIFPYAESTRRQFSFLYTVGVIYNDYIERTVFLKDEETLPSHRLTARLSVRQPWGEARGSLTFHQYLHDASKNRFNAYVGADFRIFRGFSLNVNGNYSRIRDQLNVPAGDATTEEVLLRQRVLQSGYEYGVSVGFAYRFGSIYSNVVNPRLSRF